MQHCSGRGKLKKFEDYVAGATKGDVLQFSTLFLISIQGSPLKCTANIFDVIFTVFNCVPISTVILLYGLHFIAAPSTV